MMTSPKMEQRIRTAGWLVLFSGVALYAYSLTLNPYTNAVVFNEKYMALAGSDHASEDFFKLRDEFLTPKYKIEDYACTLGILGASLLSMVFFKKKIQIVPRKSMVFTIGLTAALMTVFGYVGDLFLEMFRGAVPVWADSIGIPLMAVSAQLIIFLMWAGVNAMAMLGSFQTGIAILPLTRNDVNYWFAFILALTMLITLACIADGYFWQIIPGMLWSYFYLSLWAGRKTVSVYND